jgi:type VI secretion system protein ImpL
VQALLGMVAGGGAGGGGSAAAQLQDIAQGVPKPVAAMLQAVTQSSSQVTSSGATQQLSDAWGSKVVPLCQDAFNRYPFVDSAQDVPQDDFAHLLGPGGLMDQFFDQYLKPLVDTSQKPWRWQSSDHTKLGLGAASLTEFERAADIRDALFQGGGKIEVKFQLMPLRMDPGLSQISIEIGSGERMAYAQGPLVETRMQWPAADGATQMRVTMTPSGGGQATVTENSGPWSLLRMLDAAQITKSGAMDVVDITFSSPAGKAYFKLTAGSVHNPFTLPALRTFRCPAKL